MIDNQHRKITGYRDLSEDEIALMNDGKQYAEDIGRFVASLSEMKSIDQRWLDIARTQLQQGFMALIRSIAQPETF